MRFAASAFLALSIVTPAHADVKAGVEAWSLGDYAGAVREWRAAAIAGEADAQFNLGMAYRLGRGVPMDLKQAEMWFGKAADRGHLPARDNLGLVMFQAGKRAESMDLIEEAAGRGYPAAQYVYATELFNGTLVKKDWVRAYALMTRASQAGSQPASASLAKMDAIIPHDQRTRGIALAQAFEAHAQVAPTATPKTVGPIGGDPAPAEPAAPLVRYADVAPAPVEPPLPVAPPRVMADAVPAPAKAAIATPAKRAAPPAAAAPLPARIAVAKPTPKPAPAPVRSALPMAGGAWFVQVAALSDATRAPALWSGLRARHGLGAYTLRAVAAGPMTRVQFGPVRSRADADTLCRTLRAGGQSCLPVAP